MTETVNIAVLGNHIADEAVKRLMLGKAVGTPSLHNIIREAAIDVIATEMDYVEIEVDA